MTDKWQQQNIVYCVYHGLRGLVCLDFDYYIFDTPFVVAATNMAEFVNVILSESVGIWTSYKQHIVGIRSNYSIWKITKKNSLRMKALWINILNW